MPVVHGLGSKQVTVPIGPHAGVEIHSEPFDGRLNELIGQDGKR
jgi:hypothetical protein